MILSFLFNSRSADADNPDGVEPKSNHCSPNSVTNLAYHSRSFFIDEAGLRDDTSDIEPKRLRLLKIDPVFGPIRMTFAGIELEHC